LLREKIVRVMYKIGNEEYFLSEMGNGVKKPLHNPHQKFKKYMYMYPPGFIDNITVLFNIKPW